MKIFVVEDNEEFVEMLAQYFSKLGYFAVFTATAEVAIEKIQQMNASFEGVFLVDMQLAGKLSGVNFIEWLRENGIYNPVVVMTGNTTPDLVNRCLDKLRVNCFIEKPFSLALIKMVLERAYEARMLEPYEGIFIKQSSDGSHRYLLPEKKVEFLGMDLPERRIARIVCISSQRGCGMRCKFCATGMHVRRGVRNLSAEEMLQQVEISQYYYPERRKDVDVLIMGMGEPSCNLKNIEELVEKLDEKYRVIISTVGIVSKLKKLVKMFRDNPRVELQFSLHFPWDELRAKHMPVAKNNLLGKIFPLLENFAEKSILPVSINYALFKGLNEDDEHIEALAKLLLGKRMEVKLSEANPFGIYMPVSSRRVEEIEKILDYYGILYHQFRSKGKDVDAGCGQMAAKIGKRR